MKIFDIKDVFSWSNAEEAKQYIGKQGYFANTMTQLRDSINKNEVYILCKIFEDVGNCFYTTESSHSIGYDFFLPVDKVKEVEEEKKYRPFKSVNEFQQYYKVGYILHLKDKEDDTEEHTLITSIIFDKNEPCIVLGSYSNRGFTLDKLFEKYEVKQNGKYQPFGVLDES